ncbi:MAG TPA: ferritin-like domain-containing protein [Rhodothermales bacterium]
MILDSLHSLFVHELKDLYSAETQLVDALPKMEQAASHDSLKAAFRQHLEETRMHVERLERICHELGISPHGEHCEAMEGLITEGEELIRAPGDPDTRDAALISAAQRVEHYEIAAYGTARTFARRLDFNDAARLLDQTLDEESATDTKLTKIATGGIFAGGVNKAAQHG